MFPVWADAWTGIVHLVSSEARHDSGRAAVRRASIVCRVATDSASAILATDSALPHGAPRRCRRRDDVARARPDLYDGRPSGARATAGLIESDRDVAAGECTTDGTRGDPPGRGFDDRSTPGTNSERRRSR